MIHTGIFGTSYIADARRQAVVRLWIRLAALLNPGFPLTIVDSASPVPVPDDCGVEVVRLGDNVGHLANGGGDGWGRAFSMCVELAIGRGLDYVAIVDTDIVLCRPVGPLFDAMRVGNWQACMPIGAKHAFPENGIFLADVRRLEQMNFVARYDWRSSRPDRLPEWHCRDILGAALHVVDLPGRRNDDGEVTADNLRALYPAGCAWLTHCVDTGPYAELMRMNAIDPAVVDW